MNDTTAKILISTKKKSSNIWRISAMKITTKTVKIMNQIVMFEMPKNMESLLNRLADALTNDKPLDIEIDVHREKRSLNANAAMWAMLGRMAAVLHTTADELYIEELRNYGAFDFVCTLPEKAETIGKQFRLYEPCGTRFVSGKKMVVLKVWLGSSTYDTKQFSTLLDGIICDAKELGVEFITSQERDLLIAEREKSNDDSQI